MNHKLLIMTMTPRCQHLVFIILSVTEEFDQTHWTYLSLMVWFGLVSLFNGISTLFRLFNAKSILLEEQSWYYLTHSWEDKGVHTFPKGICPKVNAIAYYDSAVQRFNHYTTRTPSFSHGRNFITDISR